MDKQLVIAENCLDTVGMRCADNSNRTSDLLGAIMSMRDQCEAYGKQ